MNILLISLFGTNPNSRVGKIKKYSFPNDNVTIVTSNFQHGGKKFIENDILLDKHLGIIRLSVPRYKKNLSFRRIYSHLKFASALKRYLTSLREKPDLIYCAMPTSSAAFVAGQYCKKNSIPFIIDVIDLWPDSLIPIFKYNRVVDFCLSPWSYLTKAAYRLANYISGESKAYSEVAHKINPNIPYSYTYLGVSPKDTKKLIDSSSITLEKPQDEIWIGYGGSLGNSYDFDVILKGLKELEKRNMKYKMWFIGGGEKEEYIQAIAKEENLNVEITGRIPYGDFLKCLSYCDIAINSFIEGTLVVHSYKFNDYVATGCYVLNNLSGETGEIIDKYRIGCNFNSQNFTEKLISTINNWAMLSKNLNNRIDNLINTELDTSIIYRHLGEDIKHNIAIREIYN